MGSGWKEEREELVPKVKTPLRTRKSTREACPSRAEDPQAGAQDMLLEVSVLHSGVRQTLGSLLPRQATLSEPQASLSLCFLNGKRLMRPPMQS